MDRINKRNQAASNGASKPILSHPISSDKLTKSTIGSANPRLPEVEAKDVDDDDDDDDDLSIGGQNYSDIAAGSESEIDLERDVSTIRHKRKSDYPIHREEHYMPYIWQFTDDESPYAPGCHVSASGRKKFGNPKSSCMSAAQYKSRKRRDDTDGTSSEEESHWSVDIQLN